MAFIEEKLDTDAANITGPADDKDLHPRKLRRTSPLSKGKLH